MFAAADWRVLEVEYGRRLHHLFDQEHGPALRHRRTPLATS